MWARRICFPADNSSLHLMPVTMHGETAKVAFPTDFSMNKFNLIGVSGDDGNKGFGEWFVQPGQILMMVICRGMIPLLREVSFSNGDVTRRHGSNVTSVRDDLFRFVSKKFNCYSRSHPRLFRTMRTTRLPRLHVIGFFYPNHRLADFLIRTSHFFPVARFTYHSPGNIPHNISRIISDPESRFLFKTRRATAIAHQYLRRRKSGQL